MRSMGGVVVIILFFIFNEGKCDVKTYRQEAAKVVYYNPKYIKEINIFTFRQTRRSPYLTSGNVTLKQPWDNNVTVIIEVLSAKSKQEVFSIDFKCCDAIKTPWITEWLKTYTNIAQKCPIPASMYTFDGVELPPKNFPIPLPPGEYIISGKFITTKNQEKRTYNLDGIEIPPKNFPIPFSPGDYIIGWKFITTKNKENVLNLNMKFKYEVKKRSGK